MGVRNYAEVDEHEIDEHEGDAAAFEFDYDRRRSLDESAVRFGRFLKQLARFIKAYRPYRAPLRFDVVAHSMGGLLLRYFLRYGTQYLAYDGRPPRLTWRGPG